MLFSPTQPFIESGSKRDGIPAQNSAKFCFRMQLKLYFQQDQGTEFIMKMSFLKLGSVASAFVLIFMAQSSFAQNFYKWVDAKGSTHYTSTPPPKSAQKKGKVDTHGWKNSSPTTSNNQTQSETQNASPAHVDSKNSASTSQSSTAEKEQVHQQAQEALRQGQAVSAEQK